MIVLAVIIYIVLALCFGPMWPIEMFFQGGCLGRLIVAGWTALALGGLA